MARYLDRTGFNISDLGLRGLVYQSSVQKNDDTELLPDQTFPTYCILSYYLSISPMEDAFKYCQNDVKYFGARNMQFGLPFWNLVYMVGKEMFLFVVGATTWKESIWE